MSAGVLQVEGLAKSFGRLEVLRGVTFTVAPGRILGFLGRNGAGKTTTMRCILGLLDADAGSVRFEGQPLDRRLLRGFGYMPEERGLYAKMTLHSQLVHFARLAGMSRRAAASAATDWLDRLGLADRRHARLDTLSHGNQQRLQLAAGMVHDPRVLILDEPFSGLDPIGVRQMGEVLREASRDGATILFSSHQLDLVEDLCSDVAIIAGGRVVRAGDLEEIRGSAPHRRVEVWVAGRPWRAAGLAATLVDGERPHLLVPAGITAEEVLAAAGRAGPVTAFRYEPPTLADLFHEAVGVSAGLPAEVLAAPPTGCGTEVGGAGGSGADDG